MKNTCILLSISILISSCTHVYYAPNTANAPLLSEKGETSIKALYCAGGDSQFGGGELQLAHAVSNKFALMLNFLTTGKTEEVTRFNGNNTVTNEEQGYGTYIEFAGGIFKKFHPDKKWVGDIYSGFGFGSVKNEYPYGDKSKVGIFKYFIQPSIGYKGINFEFALVPKLSYINWKVKENEIIHADNNEHRGDIKAVLDKRGFMSFEPAILARAGGKDVKVQAGLSLSTHQTKGMYSSNIIESLNASFGATINLRRKK